MFKDPERRSTTFRVIANIWCVYGAQACIIPHMTRYYDLDLGLEDTQIGLLMAVPALAMVLFQPVWGYLSDRVLGRTKTFRLGLMLCIFTLFTFTQAYRLQHFSSILAAAILFMICYGINSPLSTAVILSYLGGKRRHLFGRIRVFGSASFAFTVFFLCPPAVYLAQYWGLYPRTSIFWLGCLFFFLAFLSTWWNEDHFETHRKPELGSFQKLVQNRNLLYFFFSLFCIGMTMSSSLLYIGPYIDYLGYSERFFSSIWLTGVGIEIFFTYFMASIIHRTGLKRMIVIGFAAEGIRWLGISFFTEQYIILMFSMLHGPAVLGIFFVTATYLDSECDESVRSTAQSLLYFSLMSGQIAGYLCGSLYVGSFDNIPRAEAIQHGFFLFALIALAASLFFKLMVAEEKTVPDQGQ